MKENRINASALEGNRIRFCLPLNNYNKNNYFTLD